MPFGSSRHVCSSSNELDEVTCREGVHLFTPRLGLLVLTAIWLFLLGEIADKGHAR